MSVVDPSGETSQTIDRHKIQTHVMDHPLEVVYCYTENSNFVIHIRTIPPGLSDTNVNYWMDVVSQYEEVKAIESSDLWISLYIIEEDFERVKEIAKYSTEAYYNIFNKLA